METNWYNPDGSLKGKDLYKYDDKGNEIERNSYNPDGILKTKYTYTYDYDKNLNWIKRIELENDVQMSITIRAIEYF